MNKCSLLLSCVCLCLCLNRVSVRLPRLTPNMSHSNQFSQTHQQNILCFPAPHSTEGHEKKNSAPYLFTLWVIDSCAAVTVLLVLKSHRALRQRCSHEPLVCEKLMCVIYNCLFVCLCFLNLKDGERRTFVCRGNVSSVSIMLIVLHEISGVSHLFRDEVLQ